MQKGLFMFFIAGNFAAYCSRGVLQVVSIYKIHLIEYSLNTFVHICMTS